MRMCVYVCVCVCVCGLHTRINYGTSHVHQSVSVHDDMWRVYILCVWVWVWHVKWQVYNMWNTLRTGKEWSASHNHVHVRTHYT